MELAENRITLRLKSELDEEEEEEKEEEEEEEEAAVGAGSKKTKKKKKNVEEDGKQKKKDPFVDVKIDLGLSAYANSAAFFQVEKKARGKFERTLAAADKASAAGVRSKAKAVKSASKKSVTSVVQRGEFEFVIYFSFRSYN